ncbi:MAG: hypothetical protein DI626_02325 [Micavibrio aeruginosavorus]|uniref:Uncharacterized protein n=1 Tax=Micavibrio aeruginosavorus TaxID=349221 RepID=A0A2W5A4H2_9BACT|nr:MAG: hypothetical protein DI626_02325 [Micavibrio aeruginosavorus]
MKKEDIGIEAQDIFLLRIVSTLIKSGDSKGVSTKRLLFLSNEIADIALPYNGKNPPVKVNFNRTSATPHRPTAFEIHKFTKAMTEMGILEETHDMDVPARDIVMYGEAVKDYRETLYLLTPQGNDLLKAYFTLRNASRLNVKAP